MVPPGYVFNYVLRQNLGQESENHLLTMLKPGGLIGPICAIIRLVRGSVFRPALLALGGTDGSAAWPSKRWLWQTPQCFFRM